MTTGAEPTIPTAYLDSLNPDQREAVEHFEGPLLVLAGAGSGKTRVLTTRVVHLIHEHGVPPDRIMAVTFTNKAAGEMKDRIRGILGAEPSGMWVGTFHALGARILRRHAERLGWTPQFTIFDAEQALRQTKRAQELVDVDPRRWNPKAVRAHISGAKNQLVSAAEFVEQYGEGFDIFSRMVAKVYPRYQRELKDQNGFDFDDLLMKPVELFQSHPPILKRYADRFQFLLVDEYQDTNHAQFRFLELLAQGHRNLMVVGDDDQSIYGWRGADIKNILDFEETFRGAHVVRLERNYRSTSRILDAANAVISENVQRKGKTLRTERVGGARITIVESADETDEARWIVDEIDTRMLDEPEHEYQDFAILYRTNAQSRALEDAFRRAGMPYQIVGGLRFYERREIQDVLGYLRLISNPLDADAFQRVVNYPRRGVGAATEERLVRWAESEGLTLLEAARVAHREGPDRIPTAGAKSLEEFAELVQRYSARAGQLSVGDLLDELVEELDLLRLLRDEGPEGEDRAENVKELIAGALDFDAELMEAWAGEEPPDHFTELDLFLQQVALVTDIDRHDAESDAVTLMTLHNAKGLEYPVVFISGMEDGLFPLSRAYDEPGELEEERRLFYVGLTRAQDKVYLSHAKRRRRAGDYSYGRLSPFAEAIPVDLVEERVTDRIRREHPRRSETTGWGQYGRGQEEHQGSNLDYGVDEALNQDLPRFVKGERVKHPTFGSGSVVEVSGFGRDLKVTVRFDTVGRKKLLVRYAGLEKDF